MRDWPVVHATTLRTVEDIVRRDRLVVIGNPKQVAIPRVWDDGDGITSEVWSAEDGVRLRSSSVLASVEEPKSRTVNVRIVGDWHWDSWTYQNMMGLKPTSVSKTPFELGHATASTPYCCVAISGLNVTEWEQPEMEVEARVNVAPLCVKVFVAGFVQLVRLRMPVVLRLSVALSSGFG